MEASGGAPAAGTDGSGELLNCTFFLCLCVCAGRAGGVGVVDDELLSLAFFDGGRHLGDRGLGGRGLVAVGRSSSFRQAGAAPGRAACLGIDDHTLHAWLFVA